MCNTKLIYITIYIQTRKAFYGIQSSQKINQSMQSNHWNGYTGTRYNTRPGGTRILKYPKIRALATINQRDTQIYTRNDTTP